MPVHDWTRVAAGVFHDFHQAWIVAIRDVLNTAVLPEGYYAMAEQIAGRPHPDVLTLAETPAADSWPEPAGGAGAGLAVADQLPKIRDTLESEARIYAARADHVTVYHASGDRVVAFLEIVSPGNKDSQVAVQQFLEKLAAALDQGHHVLIIDVHPPSRHDPEGLHAAFWGSTPGVTAAQPLSLAAYRADASPTAYFEPIAPGDLQPDMPLFLTSDRYVNVPLEATYQTAWRGFPSRWKRLVT